MAGFIRDGPFPYNASFRQLPNSGRKELCPGGGLSM
jgi:hypothetical protein